MTTATERKPLEVTLPVCPTCLAVSKVPGYGTVVVRSACTGPLHDGHKKATMKPRLFREVTDD